MTSLFLKVTEGLHTYSSIRVTKVISRCCQARLTYNLDIIRNNTGHGHPTHNLIPERKFCVHNNNKKKEETINPAQISALENLVYFTQFFSVKFLLCNILDASIKYHINKRFLLGASEAFLYVTECLKSKSYRHLSEIVTPELLNKLEDERHIKSASAKSEFVRVKHFHLMSLKNIDLRVDRETQVKTIEVLIRFTYFTKKLPSGQSSSELMSRIYSDKKLREHLHFANFKFFRTYGENMKDSQWLIKDIYYFTLRERLLLRTIRGR